jgi:hypothetical protein
MPCVIVSLGRRTSLMACLVRGGTEALAFWVVL